MPVFWIRLLFIYTYFTLLPCLLYSVELWSDNKLSPFFYFSEINKLKYCKYFFSFHTLSCQSHNRSHQSVPQDHGRDVVLCTPRTRSADSSYYLQSDLRLRRV